MVDLADVEMIVVCNQGTLGRCQGHPAGTGIRSISMGAVDQPAILSIVPSQ